MFFTLGIESPKNENEAFGIVIPALEIGSYGCVSAADFETEIYENALEAIDLVLLSMAEDEFDVGLVVDKGAIHYSKMDEYSYCDAWIAIQVDLSKYESKQKRINVSLPSHLISVIDNYVEKSSNQYKDRSDFLAKAARKEIHL